MGMKTVTMTLVYLFVLSVIIGVAVFAPPPMATSTIEILVTLDPEKINLDAPPPGPVVIAVLEFPKSSKKDVKDIDPSTVLLDGVIPLSSYVLETKKFKAFFDKQAYVDYLWTKMYHLGYIEPFKNVLVEITVTGNLYDGTPFQGSDTIYVSAK